MTLLSHAQGQRPWTKGPVTWDDFMKVDSGDINEEIKILVDFQKRDTVVITDKQKYRFSIVDAVMSDKSLVCRDRMNDHNLAYAQTYFDIAQSYARAYMDSLIFNTGNVDELKSRQINRLRAAEDEFRNSGGVSLPSPLYQSVDITKVNYFRSKKVSSFGVYALAGLPLTYLNDFLSGTIGGGVELGFQYGRLFAMCDLALGISQIYKGNTLGLTSENEVPAKYVSLMLRPGFELTKPESRFKLAAFTGIGVQLHRFTISNSTSTPGNYKSYGGVAISEGLKASFQIGRTTADFLGGSFTENSKTLNVRVWSDQMIRNGAMIPSAFLSIGYSVCFRSLKH